MNSKFLYTILCFFFFVCFSSSSSFVKNHSCQAQQSLDLLLFKQNLFSINHAYGDESSNDLVCHERFGSGYYPKMLNWNTSTDCCTWDGVTCHQVTGDVIGLDLSCGMLRGSLHPNSTIFNLPHLQSLNLAYNDFGSSSLPHEIGRFANSLTHLNITSSLFSGPIPSEISFLPKLVSLDLKWNRFSIEPHVFINLLQNSTHLRELLLSDVSISLVLPEYLNVSSSLELLDLSSAELHGKLPDNIFHLPFLEKLDLSRNYDLSGALPKINRSTSIALKWLSLSSTGLSGVLPNSIGHINSLNYLDLSHTNLSGEIPDSVGHLVMLDTLYLSSTKLSGEIPYSIGHMRFLKSLDLSNCNFIGSLPNSLGNLRHLTKLDLSLNKINGTLPSSLFTLPSLEDISLQGNMLSGSIPSELFTPKPLKRLSLGQNQLAGHIDMLDHDLVPPLFSRLSNLTYLDLSFNNFTGSWELETLFSSLGNLDTLLLSYSGLFVVPSDTSDYVNPDFDSIGLASCKLTAIPNSLKAMKNLHYLDLSDNQINGSMPNWIGEIGGTHLQFFNLSHNFITSLPQFQWDALAYLILTSNLIQGSFPLSICNMSSLFMLDMSNNFFSGVIPPCFGYLSNSLQMVDLRNNSFEGTIPDLFKDCGQLDGIILNGNQLQGEVPPSFSRCQSLKILDLGNNNLNGTFPTWLGHLPELQVLILKSNKFHGPIESSSMVKLPFPSLRVLDLSHNAFVGNLPIYFGAFKAMQNILKRDTQLEYMQILRMYYSITIVVKGVLLPFSKISVAYTIVDLSDNKFVNEIPDFIGSLASLIVLNFSHNSLTGRIPNFLGNLSEIESLDLSWNQLTGEIPQSLAYLKFLSDLNIFHNHLTGRIPRGSQFNTFEGSSFAGNSYLCGFPLPKNCEGPPTPQNEEANDDEGIMSGFTWKVVVIGYGCGTLVGLVNVIVDEQELRIRRRQKIRYIHIGK